MRHQILAFIFCIAQLSCNNSSSGGGSSTGKGYLSGSSEKNNPPATITTACQTSADVCMEFVTGSARENKASIDLGCTSEGGQIVASCSRKPGDLMCSVGANNDPRGDVNYYLTSGSGSLEEIRQSCEQIGGQLKKI